MITIKTLDKVEIFTTFEDGEMVRARMESDTRTLEISLGRVSNLWSIFLSAKDRKSMSGMSLNLRTYTNKTWDEMVEYWDNKLETWSK